MRKRQCELTVRLTETELCSLDEKVKRTIFTREEFCRRILADKTTREIFPPDFPILSRDSRRLCNVLHQLLEKATGTSSKAAQMLRAALDEAQRWNKKMIKVYTQDEENGNGKPMGRGSEDARYYQKQKTDHRNTDQQAPRL